MSNTLYACITKAPTHNNIVQTYGGGDVSNIHVARAAFLKNVEWPQNKNIKVAFMKQPFEFEGNKISDPEYTEEKAKWVEKMVEEHIVSIANLSFEWDVSLEESDVRISFVKSLGSFSYLGTQALEQPKNTITMNLGWIDKDVASSDSPIYSGTGIVVLHEFGHLLGMIHEHSRADAKLNWNKPVVYKNLGGPPNSWSKIECDEQIFKQYAVSSFNGSVYDPHSAMHYIFPDKFFTNSPDLVPSTKYSDLDIVWINKKYPGKPLPKGVNPDQKAMGSDSSSWLKNNWYVIVIGLVVIGFVVMIIRSKLEFKKN
jgi:hypothetical protein